MLPTSQLRPSLQLIFLCNHTIFTANSCTKAHTYIKITECKKDQLISKYLHLEQNYPQHCELAVTSSLFSVTGHSLQLLAMNENTVFQCRYLSFTLSVLGNLLEFPLLLCLLFEILEIFLKYEISFTDSYLVLVKKPTFVLSIEIMGVLCNLGRYLGCRVSRL